MPEELATIETPETGTTPAGETPAGTAGSDSAAELEQLRKALRDVNRESAARRKEIEAYKDAEAKRKQAEMTELEKAQAERVELENRYNQLVAEHDGLRLRQSFFDEVAKQGVQFTSEQARADAYELADLAAALEGGEVQPKALADAIKNLQKTRPYLFGQAATPPDIGAMARGGDDGLPEVTDAEVLEHAATFSLNPAWVDRRALAQAKKLASKGK